MIVMNQTTIKEQEIEKYFKFVDSGMSLSEKNVSLEFYDSPFVQELLGNICQCRKSLDKRRNLLKLLEASKIIGHSEVSGNFGFLTNNHILYKETGEKGTLKDMIDLAEDGELIQTVLLMDIL